MKLRSQKPLLVSQRATLIAQLDEAISTSVEYENLLKRIAEIDAILVKRIVSRETLVKVAANIAGIALILVWEDRHVVTSKAFGREQKL